MIAILFSLFVTLCTSFRTGARMQIEILALRHQLGVLQRTTRGLPKLRLVDSLLWVWLSRVWVDWSSALLIVKPETVIAWHRKGFRLYWMWKSRFRLGRPGGNNDVRDLIRKMSIAN